MAINFPASPATNDTYTVGNKTWIYNGYAWDLVVGNTAPAFDKANSSYSLAQVAFDRANLSNDVLVITGAYDKANAALPNTTGAVFNGNLNIKTDLSVSNNITTSNTLTFSTASTIAVGEGQVTWNPDESTLDIGLANSSVLQVGQETLYRVKNQTGSTITQGTVVMAAGTLGASGRIKVTPAISDGTYPSKYLMGIATSTIANGGDGYVTHFGKVRGIDTSMWSEGDILYANVSVPGGLQNTAPVAPNTKTTVAIVISKHASTGTLFVRPTYGSKLNEDELVELSSLTNGDVLVYNSTPGRFENKVQLALNAGSVNGLTANTIIEAANGYSRVFANSVGTAGNSYTDTVVTSNLASAKSYTDTVVVANLAIANAYSRVFANSVGTAGNAYTDAVLTANVTGANNYVSATYYAKTGGTISGDVVITGNVTISGNTTYANTQTLLIGDNILTLNADIPNNVAPSENAGLEVNRGNKNSNAAITWNETACSWMFTSNTQTNYTTAIASNTSVDSAGAKANSYADTVVTANLATAKSYSDTVVVANLAIANAYTRVFANTVGTTGNAYTDTVVTANLTSAKSYTDTVVIANLAIANAYSRTFANSVGTSANAYTDTVVLANVAIANAYSRVFANSVGTAGNSYTDTVVTSNLSSAKSYTNTYVDTVVTANLTSAKSYSDTVVVANLVIANAYSRVFANTVGAAGNTYTDTVTLANVAIANAYSRVFANTVGAAGNANLSIATIAANAYTDAVLAANVTGANNYVSATYTANTVGGRYLGTANNADLLDGNHASYFLANATGTLAGALTTTGNLIFPVGYFDSTSLQMGSSSQFYPQLTITNFRNDTYGPYWNTQKSRANGAVVSGDTLGTHIFRGHDGTQYLNSSYIASIVDGTVATNIVPSRLDFLTSNSSGVFVHSLTLTSNGNVAIGRYTANYPLDVVGTVNASSVLVNGTVVTLIANNYAGVMANSVNANLSVATISANNYAGVMANSVNANLSVVAASVNANLSVATIAANNFAGAMANAANANTSANYLAKVGGTVSGDLIITGNLTISGNTTYANTQTLLIGDNILTLNNDLPAAVAPSEDAGLEIRRGSSSNVSILWRETYDVWTLTNDGTTWYNIATNNDVATLNTYAASAYSANAITSRYLGTANNADYLDGYHATYFLANTTGTLEGVLTVKTRLATPNVTLDNDGFVYWGAGDGSSYIRGNSISDVVSIGTASANRLTVNVGNIGIGRTDPAVALDVVGTVNASSIQINGTTALTPSNVHYLGTTSVSLSRGSGALSLAGVSIDGAAGSVTNALTFNNAGSGDASGTTYNGGTARTLSYNSIGALPNTTGAVFVGDLNVTGNINVDSATLFVDKNANRVGIGTSTPATALDVNGGIAERSGPGSAGFTWLGDIATANWTTTQGGYNLTFLNDNATGNLGTTGVTAYSTTFHPKVAFTSSGGANFAGNVGIGNTSPSAKLQVNGGDNTGGISGPSSGTWASKILMNQNLTAYNGLSVQTRWGTSTSTVLEAAAGWNGSAVGYYPLFSVTADGATVFKSPTSELVRITSAGNVGVGNTNPQSKLHVAGSVTLDNNYYLRQYNSTGTVYNILGVDTSNTTRLYSASGILHLNPDASSGSTYLNYNSPGFVQVGDGTNLVNVSVSKGVISTVSPNTGARWVISGKTLGKTNDSGLYQDGANNMQLAARDGSNNLRVVIDSNASSSSYINAGNFGIGNTSPSSKLVVNATSTTAASLTWDAAAGQIFRNEASELAVGLSSSSPYPLYMQGRTSASAARNLSLQPLGGNVGIGNTSPGFPLVVQAGVGEVRVVGTNYSKYSWENTGAGSDAKKWQLWNDTAAGALLLSTINDAENSASIAMRVGRSGATVSNVCFETGSVGVGTTAPAYKLDVTSSARIVNHTFDASSIELNSSGTGNRYAYIDFHGDDTYTDYAFRIIRYNTGVNAGSDLLHRGTGTLSITAQDAAPIQLNTTNTNRLYIMPAGNVGIGGITSPAYTLQVNGSFAANTKSFVIDHPSKPGMKLRYGSLEGPENGVYIRGRLTNEHHIQFPDYWKDLVDIDSVTVQLTPIGKSKQPSVGDITDFGVNVIGKNIDCFYFILAERKDVEKLVVEFDA